MLRRIALALLLLLGTAAGLRAQSQASNVGNTQLVRFTGAPTGTCVPNQEAIDNSTNDFYICSAAGMWVLVGSGGGPTAPGSPAGSIQWNNAGAFGGITGTAVASDLLTWTSQAAGTVPFSMVGHATQSVPVLDISHTATATCDALVCVRGDGVGTDIALESNIIDTDASYNVVWGNAAANQRWGWYVDAGDGLNLGPLVATAPVNVSAILKASAFSSPAADPADAGIVRLANAEQICWEAAPAGTDSCIENNGAEQFVFNFGIVAPAYNTTTNCSDPAGAAACGAAPAGLVVIDAGATSVVISTTAVNDNTEVFFQATTSAQAATRLGIGGCNGTVAIPSESARTSGVSITATIPAAPVTTPLCLYYWLVN